MGLRQAVPWTLAMRRARRWLGRHISGERLFSLLAAGVGAWMIYALVHGQHAMLRVYPCVCP